MTDLQKLQRHIITLKCKNCDHFNKIKEASFECTTRPDRHEHLKQLRIRPEQEACAIYKQK